MTGPNLKTDAKPSKGMRSLKDWLANLPADDRTIVEWVIQNFVPNEGNAQNTSGIPAPPATGTYVLGAINGALVWINTTTCS